MTCEKAMNIYCALDKNESLPLALSVHVLFCPRCKRLIDQMEAATLLDNRITSSDQNATFVKQTMYKIEKIQKQSQIGEPDLTKKHVFGFLLFLAAILVPFVVLPTLKIGQQLIDSLGIFFVLPLGALCGLTVCIVCALFIIKNSKYFIKRFDL